MTINSDSKPIDGSCIWRKRLMYVPDLETHQATSLTEAAELLTQLQPDAKIIAGGTDVLVDLKTGRFEAVPLVSIEGIAELHGLMMTEEGLRIGAMTRINELNRSTLLTGEYAAIRDASREMAAYQVRNMATVGGNVAGAVPCADLPPILITMNGKVVVWSTAGERTIAIEEFLAGPRRTTIGNGEIVTSILVPTAPQGFGAAYERFALREGNAIAVASAACGLVLDENQAIKTIRICLGAVGPIPIQVDDASKHAIGRQINEVDLQAIGAEAARAAQPIADIRGSIEYRRTLVSILAGRAVKSAHKRAIIALNTNKEGA